MKIAILGAGGFIGSRIVEMFHLNSSVEIKAVVHSLSKLAYLSRFKLDWSIANGFSYGDLKNAFQKCDVVIHAISGDVRTIVGTIEPVYKAAEDSGIKRLVYLSSASVHGQNPEIGADESSIVNEMQQIDYNNAKVKAEKKLFELRKSGKVELVILRPGIVYGPRSFWIGNFANSLIRGDAYLINRGKGICNGIYVDNLVQAIKLSLTNERAVDNVFLIGDDEQITWFDLYSPIAAALGFDMNKIPEGIPSDIKKNTNDNFEKFYKSKPIQSFLSLFPNRIRLAAYQALLSYKNYSPGYSPWNVPEKNHFAANLEMILLYRCRYKFTSTKAKEILGYTPKINFQEAIRRTVGWLSFAGYPVKNYELMK